MCVCVSVCVCVCLFLCNLGDSFVSLLVEPIAGKNVSPSNKKFGVIFEKHPSCREIVV